MKDYNTPMEANKTLEKAEPEQFQGSKVQTYFRKGVGKLLHLMRWSRPEVMNPVQELSRQMTNPGNHFKAMHRVMKYCVLNPERGWTLKPQGTWDVDKDFEFVIRGRADSDYAKCTVTRRSVSGFVTYLMGAWISAKIIIQKIVALSVIEAKLIAGVMCVQDMLYIMIVLESVGLKVKKPMVLEMDNRGAYNLANN